MFIGYAKVFVWITTNYGKFFKRWILQTTLPASQEICMQVKKQQLKLDMKQQTGSKSGQEYIKTVYCHPAYLNYMQSTSCKMLDWMKHKLESRLPDIQMTKPYGIKLRRTKEPLDESERGEWKSCFKTQHSENEDHGIRSHHLMANRCGNSGNSDRLYFWAQKSLQIVPSAVKLKDACSLEEKLWTL